MPVDVDDSGTNVQFIPAARARFLIGDFSDWDERPIPINGPMEMIFPRGAYIEYAFLDAAGAPIADAGNPNVPNHAWYAYHRCVALPGCTFTDPPRAKSLLGSVDEFSIESNHLGGVRVHSVYEPPAPARATLFVFDGEKYFALLRLHAVAEWLAAQRTINPVRIVFLHAQARKIDYRFSSAHEQYLCRELMPYVNAHYGPTRDQALWGASLGGLTALWIGLRHPDVFTKIAAQSACLTASPTGGDNYHDPEWVTDAYARADDIPARISLDTGTIEWLLPANRRFASILAARRAEHRYAEWAGGHNWRTWEQGLVPALVHLFGR